MTRIWLISLLTVSALVWASPAYAQVSDTNTDQTDQSEEDWRRSQRKSGTSDIYRAPNSSATGFGTTIFDQEPPSKLETLPRESRRHVMRERARAIAESDDGTLTNAEFEPSEAAQTDAALAQQEQDAWDELVAESQDGTATSQNDSTSQQDGSSQDPSQAQSQGQSRGQSQGQAPSQGQMQTQPNAQSGTRGGSSRSLQEIMNSIKGGGSEGSSPDGMAQGQNGGQSASQGQSQDQSANEPASAGQAGSSDTGEPNGSGNSSGQSGQEQSGQSQSGQGQTDGAQSSSAQSDQAQSGGGRAAQTMSPLDYIRQSREERAATGRVRSASDYIRSGTLSGPEDDTEATEAAETSVTED